MSRSGHDNGVAPLFRILALFLYITMFRAVAGPAQDVDYRQAYDECIMDAGGATNGSVEMCSVQVSQDVKGEMNALYKAIHDRLLAGAPQDAAKLERAQKS